MKTHVILFAFIGLLFYQSSYGQSDYHRFYTLDPTIQVDELEPTRLVQADGANTYALSNIVGLKDGHPLRSGLIFKTKADGIPNEGFLITNPSQGDDLSLNDVILSESGEHLFVAGDAIQDGFPIRYITRLDTTGSIDWTIGYNSLVAGDKYHSLIEDPDDGSIVALGIWSGTPNSHNLEILKLANDGSYINSVGYILSNGDDPGVIVKNPFTGGYIIVGGRSGEESIFAASLTPGLQQDWAFEYVGNSTLSSIPIGRSRPSSVSFLEDENQIVITGTYHRVGMFGVTFIYIMILDQDGNVIDYYTSPPNRPEDVTAEGAILAPDNSLILVGGTSSTIFNSYFPLIMKVGLDGVVDWAFNKGDEPYDHILGSSFSDIIYHTEHEKYITLGNRYLLNDQNIVEVEALMTSGNPMTGPPLEQDNCHTPVPISFEPGSMTPVPRTQAPREPVTDFDLRSEMIHINSDFCYATEGGGNPDLRLEADMNISAIHISPNPISDQAILVEIEGESDYPFTCSVVDINGREILNWAGQISEGGYIQKIRTDQLSSGMYTLIVRSEQAIFHRKIVKL